jgi:hypothetical protein
MYLFHFYFSNESSKRNIKKKQKYHKNRTCIGVMPDAGCSISEYQHKHVLPSVGNDLNEQEILV